MKPKTTTTQTKQQEPEILAPQQLPESRGVAVATTTPSMLQTASVQREWEKQLELIKKTVAPGLTDDEFALFCHVARVRNLDPLQRQIHAVKRRSWNSDKGAYEERMTLQTGIDGFRAIANRTGLYMPSSREPQIEGKGTGELSLVFYVLKWSPLDKQYHEFGAVAHYREFVQTIKKDDKIKPNSMWEKMPYNQLEKCAEAKALRRAWPEELGQIYIDEELQHLDSHTSAQAQKPNDKTTASGTLEPSAEPNRGHGNEATQQGVSTSQAANAKKQTKQTKQTTTTDEKPAEQKKKVETYMLTCSALSVEQKTIGSGEKTREYQIVKCKSAKGVAFSVFNWHKSYFDKVRDAVAGGKRDEMWCLEVHDQKSASKPDETFTQLDEIHMIGDRKVRKLEDGTVIYENPDAEIAATEAAMNAPEVEGF